MFGLCHNTGMKWNDRLEWKIYFFLISPLYLGNLVGVLEPRSPVFAYYHILMAFDKDYTLLYSLNIASAALNFCSLFLIFLFAFRIYWLPARFWQWFLLLRAFFDLTGHAYEMNFIKSMLYSKTIYTVPTLLLALIFIIPSYIACFKYAFTTQEDLFRK